MKSQRAKKIGLIEIDQKKNINGWQENISEIRRNKKAVMIALITACLTARCRAKALDYSGQGDRQGDDLADSEIYVHFLKSLSH